MSFTIPMRRLLWSNTHFTLARRASQAHRAHSSPILRTSSVRPISQYQSLWLHQRRSFSTENADTLKKGIEHQQKGEYIESIACFNEEIARNPNQPRLLFFRALSTEQLLTQLIQQQYLQQQNDSSLNNEMARLKAALQSDVESLVKLQPEDVNWLRLRAWYRKDYFGDHKGALEDFEKSISIDPFDAKSFEGVAFIHLQANRFDECLRNLEQALAFYAAENPGQAAILFVSHAEVLLRKNSIDMALQSLDQAIHFDPNLAPAYGLKVQILFMKLEDRQNQGINDEKLLQEMEQLSTKEIDLLSNNPSLRIPAELSRAYQSRGIIYLNMQESQKAIDDFTKSIQYDSEKPYSYLKRGSALKMQGKHEEAIMDFRQAEQQFKEPEMKCESIVECSESLSMLGRFQEAIDILSKAKELSPNNPLVFNARSKAYMGNGDSAAALKDAQIFADRTNSFYAYLNLGLIHTQTRAWKEAASDFKKALELNEHASIATLPAIHKIIGSLYSDLGQYEDAIPYLTKAIADFPQLGEIYIARAQCYYRTKEYRKAVEDMGKAISVNPDKADGYYGRAVILATMEGYQSQALVDFDKAVQLDPNHELAKKGREKMVDLLTKSK